MDNKGKELLEKSFWNSVFLLAFCFPFSDTFPNLIRAIIILISAIWIIQRKYKNITKDNLIYIAIFSSYYFINYLGLLHSENMSTAVTRLSSRLSYVIFPLVILSSSVDERKIKTIFWLFTASVTSLCSIALIKAFYAETYYTEYHRLTYTNLTDVVNQHPTYLTLNIIMSVFFLVIIFFKSKNKLTSTLLLFYILYLILFILLLISRGPILGFVAAAVFSGLYVALKNQSKRTVLALALLICVSISSIFLFPSLRERFTSPLTNISEKVNEEKQIDSSSLHYKSWYCAIELLSDYHFFTGYGSGDEKDILSSCYNQHQWKTMVNDRYNAHNEYLSCLLRNGILELLILLTTLLTALYWSIKKKNLLYFALIIIFGVSLIFTTLNDFGAIILFSFFNALLFAQCKIIETNQSKKL